VAGDGVEQRRLTGAVRPHDGEELALLYREGQVLDRLQAAVALRYIDTFKTTATMFPLSAPRKAYAHGGVWNSPSVYGSGKMTLVFATWICTMICD
jgi:hypothetical protein